MHEHVSYKAPSLLRGKRPEGTKVGNVFGNATITEAGQIQVQPENVAANERQCKNDRVNDQQHSKDFGEKSERSHNYCVILELSDGIQRWIPSLRSRMTELRNQ